LLYNIAQWINLFGLTVQVLEYNNIWVAGLWWFVQNFFVKTLG